MPTLKKCNAIFLANQCLLNQHFVIGHLDKLSHNFSIVYKKIDTQQLFKKLRSNLNHSMIIVSNHGNPFWNATGFFITDITSNLLLLVWHSSDAQDSSEFSLHSRCAHSCHYSYSIWFYCNSHPSSSSPESES